jgi:hypothetical protein
MDGVVVDARSDGFHIKFHDEEAILDVDEAHRFAGELGRARKPELLPQAVAKSSEPRRPETCPDG